MPHLSRAATSSSLAVAICCSTADAQTVPKSLSLPRTITSVDSVKLDKCNPARSELAGRAKIVVTPASLSYIFGGVPPRAAWLNNTAEDEGQDENDDDVDPTNPNRPAANPNLNKADPFHVYLKQSYFPQYSAARRYLLVRVVLPAWSDFTFYQDNRRATWIQGVAKSKEKTPEDVLCIPAPPTGPIPPEGAVVTKPKGRQIVKFYVDLSKVFGTGAAGPIPFNIILNPKTAPETTIVIDPKMINEG